jgi:hypothetical protein
VTYGTVLKDYGGDIGQRCWMDRNLGASQVATASNDPLGYGDTFQWGRLDDGHQDRQSGKTSTPSNTDVPGHGNFITGAGVMSDWRSPQNDNLWQGDNGINNPCPTGWRIPTEAELNAERLSWGSNNSGGAFESSLKLTVGGYRDNSGSLVYVNSAGIYWTSDVSGGQARYLNFQSNAGLMYFHGRTGGFSVRCVREETATADAPTVTTEAITGITTTTATGGGNVTSDGGAAVTDRGICYSTSPTPPRPIRQCRQAMARVAFRHYVMTGLKPRHKYYVRAYATNSTGTAYGSQVSFVTSEDGHEVGGLIGKGTAINSYATGHVQARGDYVGGLIGLLAGYEGLEQQPEYLPGEAAPGTTETETASTISQPNQATIVSLGDGTRVLIPGQDGPLNITLEKSSPDVQEEEVLPPWTNFRTTGSMRKLTITGNTGTETIKPVITFPIEEAGYINLETINVLRISHMDIEGELHPDHVSLLPILEIDNTGLKFTDILFPEAVMDDAGKSTTRQQATSSGWVGEVRYILMSFDKSLNWSKRPVLEQMIPDTEGPDNAFRQPVAKAGAEKRNELLKKPVCNVVILVHGHNEEEKDGYLNSLADSPWEFNYKRLVWELLYEELANDTEDPSMPQYFSDCTIFYEYIYPTYRPIFSPVTDRTGYNHQTLGEDMGRLINEEFLVLNPQLKAMINNNMDFNLFVVAHSQGGLVSRAGLRFIDDRILKHLKQFVSWGSPHIGAGLYSLRYALAAGHDMIIDGYRFPLQHIGQSQAYQSALSGLVLDAPGVRDMRFDASKKDMLRLGELLRENTTTLSEFPHTELPNGKMFFSENLSLFNQAEGDWIGDMLRDKYLLYVGTTPKEASIELRFSFRSIYRNYQFAKHASEIEKGAFLNKLAMKPAFNANDGAVPAYSQSATSLWPEGNIKRKHYDDMDHEEFYGAEHPHRNETSIGKGRKVAQDTYNDLGLSSTSPYRATRTCPELVSIESEQEGNNIIITGRLNYPIYQAAHGGDGKPGTRVKRFEMREKDARGHRLSASLSPTRMMAPSGQLPKKTLCRQQISPSSLS